MEFVPRQQRHTSSKVVGCNVSAHTLELAQNVWVIWQCRSSPRWMSMAEISGIAGVWFARNWRYFICLNDCFFPFGILSWWIEEFWSKPQYIWWGGFIQPGNDMNNLSSFNWCMHYYTEPKAEFVSFSLLFRNRVSSHNVTLHEHNNNERVSV